MNSAAEAILGYDREERKLPHSERMALREMAWPDGTEMPAEASPTGRAFLGEVVKNFPMVLKRKGTGQKMWISVSAAPIRDEAGHIVGAIGSFIDISRQRQVEQELQRAKEIASEVLEPRTREAGNRQFVGMIREQARALLAGRKGLGFTLKANPALPRRLVGEPALLSRVLQNLLSNAVKYTDRGGVRLQVRRQEEGPEGRPLWIRFEVADTGIGIPNASRPRLFQSFERLHGTLTRIHHEGTGLGLAIARQLVVRMGGEIGVESEEGVGSTFWFTLPFEPVREGAGAGETAGEAAGRPAVAHQPLAALPPLRILLAEDNRVNRLFLQTALEDAGHRVAAVEDGRQALEALRAPAGGSKAGAFDLVLMDIQMPRLDGLEATRAIRALPGEAARLPVIALTAFAAQGDARRFRQAGLDGYVSKPVDFGRLAEEIRRVRPGS